jgi:hypothetical protein
VEDEAGNPLEAMICIPEHDMHHSEVVTDADYGNYHRPIYFGSYDLEISAWGYMTEEMNGVTAPLHDITWQDVTLQPAALCQLSGEVTDLESGLPVFGAWVELLDTPLEAVMTDPEGCFSINDIPVDEYQIAVFAGGYNSSLETINLETGMNIYNCQLQSSPALSFESGEFPAGFDFYSSGNANWFITDDSAHNGLYAARSGDIDDREITTLHLDIELEEAGSINFWLKVSSEADWDFLYFYIDDDLQDEWSGSIDWTEQSYNLSEGEHQLKWEYDKDTSVSSGSDCAWLDDILITGLPEVETVFGDIDNNGVVEAFDASLVQRFVVGIFPGPAAPLPWQYWRLIRADVDGNLIIEAYDASLILQYWVGLINSFPVEVRAGK